MFAVRRWIITRTIGAQPCHSTLMDCLERLLRVQLATPPPGIPLISRFDGAFQPKYSSTLSNAMSSIYDPRELWDELRNEVDSSRLTSLALPEFVAYNFDIHTADGLKSYESAKKMYDQHVKNLEVAEARLRDEIEMISSGRSTEMAKRSIEESKRVMLLTILAFVFVPMSLASSIYGMNVQQINETGHSIKAFVITAIVLLPTTFLFWGRASSLIQVRNFRIEKRVDKVRADQYEVYSSQSLIDKILLVDKAGRRFGPVGRLRRMLKMIQDTRDARKKKRTREDANKLREREREPKGTGENGGKGTIIVQADDLEAQGDASRPTDQKNALKGPTSTQEHPTS